jgi:hypothetical protein
MAFQSAATDITKRGDLVLTIPIHILGLNYVSKLMFPSLIWLFSFRNRCPDMTSSRQELRKQRTTCFQYEIEEILMKNLSESCFKLKVKMLQIMDSRHRKLPKA